MKPAPLNQRMVIRVTGQPKGQPRIKAFRRGNFVKTYTPNTADEWKDAVTQAAIRAKADNGWIQVPLRVPVAVSIDFHFRRPSGFRKGERFKYTKPDRDNADKAVLDALTWAGLFADDSQVVDGRIRKLLNDDWQGAVITVASGNYLDGETKEENDGIQIQPAFALD